MNLILAIFGSIVGLFITGVAVYTAWMVHQLWKQAGSSAPLTQSPQSSDYAPSIRQSHADIAGRYLSRWTVWDYGVLALFMIGMLLLAADVIAMMRDREAYPDFHYAYLLCGITFTVMSMLLLFGRLAIVLSVQASLRSVSPQHHHEPSHADHAE